MTHSRCSGIFVVVVSFCVFVLVLPPFQTFPFWVLKYSHSIL